MTSSLLAVAQDPIVPSGSDAQLILSAVVGIAVIIVLITWLKLHPFLALLIGAIGIGIAAGLDPAAPSILRRPASAHHGRRRHPDRARRHVRQTARRLGRRRPVVDTLVTRSSERALPWTMALVGALIGLPMFFEVGLVLLMPVIILVARRSGLPLMRIAIPTLAGLSAMHGLVPPHPGPLVAITTLNANLGLTLAMGVLIAIPTIVIAGPLFSTLAARWAPVPVPNIYVTAEDEGVDPRPAAAHFATALFSILLPVVLMLAKALADVFAEDSEAAWKALLDFLGTPTIALTIAVLVGIVVLGRGGKMDRSAIAQTLEKSLPPIAGILLIVGAGGGLKQVLIDTGIGQVIADAIEGSSYRCCSWPGWSPC